MLTEFRPNPGEQVEMLLKNESTLQKSDESAWTIVPSQSSSSVHTGGSTQSIESVKFVYRRLSCEDDLFTARVYKRKFFAFRQREASKPGKRTLVKKGKNSSHNNFGESYHTHSHQKEALDGLESISDLSGPQDSSSDYAASSLLRFYQRPSSSRDSSIFSDWVGSSSNYLAAIAPDGELDTWHLDLAVQQGQVEILDVLLKDSGIAYEKWIRQQLLQPSLYDQRQLVNCLIQHGGNFLDTEHLDIILAKGHFEILETLLKQDERTSIEMREHPPRSDDRKSLSRHRTWAWGKFDAWKQDNMILACSEGNANLMQCLLRCGATIEEIHLDYAEALESQEILHILLGKDHSRFRKWKERKLMAACVAQNQELIVRFLEQNATLDHEDLDELVDCGLWKILEILMNWSHHKEWTSKWKEYRLVKACCDGNEQLVNFFLDQGVSVDSRELLLSEDLDGDRTALHSAVCHGHINIVNILLNRGANVHKFNNTFRGPLHDAALNGAVDMIAVLLENGASVDTRDEASYRPLHFASRSGSSEAVRLLLVAGAAIDCVGNDGLQSLHHAAQFCVSQGLATFLVSHGASIEATTNFGYTPLELACESGHIFIVKELLSLGAQLRAPYKCHFQGESITNPLGLATINRHLDIVEELLSQNADPNICNSATGASAIHILAACYRAGTETPLSTTANCIQLLLKWGAEVASRDHAGRQAFHYLARYPHSDLHRRAGTHVLAMNEVAVVLKRAGADINVRDLSGATPLDEAIVSQEAWVVKILLDHGASRIRSEVMESLVWTSTERNKWPATPLQKKKVGILTLLRQYKVVV